MNSTYRPTPPPWSRSSRYARAFSGISQTAPGATAMSCASVTFSSTAIGLPDSSSMSESWDIARFSSRSGSLSATRSETPQNCFGSRTFG